MSHTKELIEEAIDKLEKYLEEKRLTEDLEAVNYGASVKRTGINRYFNKLGIHVVRLREWQYGQKFNTNYFGKLSSVQFFKSANRTPESFDEIYNLLADEASKAAFNWYVQYRTAYAFIGEEAYELFTPQITREAWDNMEKRIRRNAKHVYQVDEFTIEGTADELVGTFVVQQYRYDSIVEPKLGDIVFDIGAYVGDTALWFSKAVGPQGKVYAFEPEPSNFEKLKANLERNKVTNVIPLQLAVSETEGEMQVSSAAGSSVITQAGTGLSVKVTTIDKFMEANKLPRVDFIKMDVEGHELKVLKGADETIKTFKPSLALSAYHRGDDIIQLPKFLLELNPHYRFYLRHCSPDLSETVLYAVTS
ncbi:FkbM family methyltransferase [Coprothermobacter proteolyticus]|uniref:FkbM family methyltransferase n=1 Tax=Coprothermobacter proteolyticus TaxID=35786 RepID=UPI000D2FD06D|nr:FkbM family methyltransferase [Coprothermobacter proteolyticus]